MAVDFGVSFEIAFMGLNETTAFFRGLSLWSDNDIATASPNAGWPQSAMKIINKAFPVSVLVLRAVAIKDEPIEVVPTAAPSIKLLIEFELCIFLIFIVFITSFSTK